MTNPTEQQLTALSRIVSARIALGEMRVSSELADRVEAGLVPRATSKQRRDGLLAVAELASEIDPGASSEPDLWREHAEASELLQVVTRGLAECEENVFTFAYELLLHASAEIANLNRQIAGKEPAPSYLPRSGGSVEQTLQSELDQWQGDLVEAVELMVGAS